jgi:hypothetical protein
MRRWKLLVALAGPAVAVAVGVVVLWPTQPNRITQENCDRIKKGMSRAEVETILGPPGDYRTGPGQGVLAWDPILDGTTRLNECTNRSNWAGDTGWVSVEFDNGDGTVRASEFIESKRIAQGPLENLLWRAKRQWHRWFPE